MLSLLQHVSSDAGFLRRPHEAKWWWYGSGVTRRQNNRKDESPTGDKITLKSHGAIVRSGSF